MTRMIASLPAWVVFGFLLSTLFMGKVLPHPLGLIVKIAALLTWIYALGSEAQQTLPQHLQLPYAKFRFSLLYVATYSVIASFVLNEIMPYVLPFHFLASLCMFYGLYFTARAIKTAELNRTVKCQEWFVVFCGIWFFPIGVWFIQRKIRRITAGPEHA